MSERFGPPKVTIRRYLASQISDVVIVVRGQEMVVRCPSFNEGGEVLDRRGRVAGTMVCYLSNECN
jgi:hypothetical protein